MCISLPAKIRSVAGQLAEIELNGQIRQVLITVPKASAGDWVLIYGNAIIAVLDEQEALESSRLIGQLQEAASQQSM